MAQYRGGVQGGCGEATRLGHKNSGLMTWNSSWKSKVQVNYWWDKDKEEDCFTITVTFGDKSVVLFSGTEMEFEKKYKNRLR